MLQTKRSPLGVDSSHATWTALLGARDKNGAGLGRRSDKADVIRGGGSGGLRRVSSRNAPDKAVGGWNRASHVFMDGNLDVALALLMIIHFLD